MKLHRRSRQRILRDDLRDLVWRLCRDGEIDGDDAIFYTVCPTPRIVDALEARRERERVAA
jgi:hypothetical protein